jgi:hypothetical protein
VAWQGQKPFALGVPIKSCPLKGQIYYLSPRHSMSFKTINVYAIDTLVNVY